MTHQPSSYLSPKACAARELALLRRIAREFPCPDFHRLPKRLQMAVLVLLPPHEVKK